MLLLRQFRFYRQFFILKRKDSETLFLLPIAEWLPNCCADGKPAVGFLRYCFRPVPRTHNGLFGVCIWTGTVDPSLNLYRHIALYLEATLGGERLLEYIGL